MFNASILTAFPELFPGPLSSSVVGHALKKGIWSIDVFNIRDFAFNNNKKIDDRPYGGGSGMVMRADVLSVAIDHIVKKNMLILNTSPRGKVLNHTYAKDILQNENILIICSHYEGIDQRVLDFYNIQDISIGNYVISGGEIAAMTILDCCIRLIPGVLKNYSSLDCESFTCCGNESCLVEYSHYTRPAVWRGINVPDVLKSGNHSEIKRWRDLNSRYMTSKQRPDLWELYCNNNIEEK